jgi:ankyrin repeat protein
MAPPLPLERHYSGSWIHFQSMMLREFGDEVKATITGLSPKEIKKLPPFPLPQAFFPEGTFPPGMRFSDDGIADLPPSMRPPPGEVDEDLGNATSVLCCMPACRIPSVFRWPGRRRGSEAMANATTSNGGDVAAKEVAVMVEPDECLEHFANRSLRVPSELGDDPRWRGTDMPALHRAAAGGEHAVLGRLLLHREGEATGCEDVNSLSAGESALHLAVESGHAEAAVLLLDAGASVNAPNSYGWTPLHSAAQSERSAETVSLLLGRGALLTARTKQNLSVLHVAAFNGQLGAAKVLVARGADALETDAQGLTAADLARHRSQTCPCSTDEPAFRQWGATIAFLEKVAPMPATERLAFARRSWGLLVASRVQDATEGGRLRELDLLLRCFGRESPDARDFDGSTALHSAAVAGHTEAAALLLEVGASVDAESNLRETPLHCAAREGHVETAALLVARGANVHASTKAGATPLDLAVRSSSQLPGFEAMRTLLEGQMKSPHTAVCASEAVPVR